MDSSNVMPPRVEAAIASVDAPRRVPIAAAEILVVGLARNCEKTLDDDIGVLRRAVAGFARSRYLVIESDSSDATVRTLGELAARVPEFRYISMGTLSQQHPQRSDRIAVCRNRYLDELAGNPVYADVDYVMVADLDGVNRDLTQSAVETCWQSREPWDACAANQLDAYYDVWALRHPQWCPTDCWQQYAALRPQFGHEQALLVAIHSRMVTIEPDAAWIEVDSAFGGLAIYCRKVLHGVRYAGLENNRAICEHVTLHLELRQRGFRIFINPALINAKRTPHSQRKRWYVRLRRRIESTGKRLRTRLVRRRAARDGH